MKLRGRMEGLLGVGGVCDMRKIIVREGILGGGVLNWVVCSGIEVGDWSGSKRCVGKNFLS